MTSGSSPAGRNGVDIAPSVYTSISECAKKKKRKKVEEHLMAGHLNATFDDLASYWAAMRVRAAGQNAFHFGEFAV